MNDSKCRFILAWCGPCGKPVSKDGLCEKHAAMRCNSCKAQATRECEFTGGVVCGFPLCDDCEHAAVNDSNRGFLGMGNTKHRPKAEAESK